MNFAASLHHTDIPQRRLARGPMLGWGISLLVHAGAVACLWHAWPSHRADEDSGPVNRIELRLIPIAPDAPPAPVPKLAVPRPDRTQMPARPRAAPPPRQTPTDAVSASPITISSSAPGADAGNPDARKPDTVTPTDVGTAAPAVDLQAARAAARLIARESGKGLVALPERKSVVDPNADRPVVDRFERARRVDCQKARAESANLLANVIGLAVDLAKNAIDDSGCKW